MFDAHLIDSITATLTPGLMVLIPIAWGIIMYAEFKRRSATDPARKKAANRLWIISFLSFAAPFGLWFGADSIIKPKALSEARACLVSPATEVFANGASINDFSAVIGDLQHIDDSSTRYHHSHPEKQIGIVIKTASGSCSINLGRDSVDPHEYWVFNPAYRTTTNSDIGKITTSALDKY